MAILHWFWKIGRLFWFSLIGKIYIVVRRLLYDIGVKRLHAGKVARTGGLGSTVNRYCGALK